MLAVFVACVVFAGLRLMDSLLEGRLTPWWVNLLGALLISGAYFWYRAAPARRAGVAVQLTAATALLALVVPVAYGMASSAWWVSLIGFSVLLMGHRLEGRVWALISIVVVLGLTLAEPHIQVPGAAPEPRGEVLAARVAFLVVLLLIAAAFRAEAERRARELASTAAALERAGRVKSRFLANMSHEIRTPLHGVIASTSMALEEELPAGARAHLEASQQAAKRLLDMLSQLLDYTRVETEVSTPVRAPFDLHAALGVVLAPLAAQARYRGLEFEAKADPNVLARRIGDATRVTQVVSNLVQNALKFTAEGCVSVRLSIGDDPETVVITVSDTGCGIAADRLDEIFEPFTQVDDARRSELRGVGLGLAIVSETLRVMGGSIDVDSTEGRGSTFVVALSLPPESGAAPGPGELLSEAPQPAKPKTLASHRALKVLVAEDYDTNQVLLRQMLERAGHNVHLVVDGEEAWQALTSDGPFDVLLTDIEMPYLDGLELAARVRAHEQATGAPRLPIIGITAHIGDDERHRILAAGIDRHLPKPFTQRDLAAVIGEVFAP